MSWWQFWAPKHTFADTVPRILSGLADGSIVLDETFADDEAEDGVVLQFDVPSTVSDSELFHMLSELVVAADKDHRASGGQGLRLAKVDAKQATLSLAPVSADEHGESLEAVAQHMRAEPARKFGDITMRITNVSAHIHAAPPSA